MIRRKIRRKRKKKELTPAPAVTPQNETFKPERIKDPTRTYHFWKKSNFRFGFSGGFRSSKTEYFCEKCQEIIFEIGMGGESLDKNRQSSTMKEGWGELYKVFTTIDHMNIFVCTECGKDFSCIEKGCNEKKNLCRQPYGITKAGEHWKVYCLKHLVEFTKKKRDKVVKSTKKIPIIEYVEEDPFGVIPDDCFGVILSFLSFPKDLLNVALVCKRFVNFMYSSNYAFINHFDLQNWCNDTYFVENEGNVSKRNNINVRFGRYDEMVKFEKSFVNSFFEKKLYECLENFCKYENFSGFNGVETFDVGKEVGRDAMLFLLQFFPKNNQLKQINAFDPSLTIETIEKSRIVTKEFLKKIKLKNVKRCSIYDDLLPSVQDCFNMKKLIVENGNLGVWDNREKKLIIDLNNFPKLEYLKLHVFKEIIFKGNDHDKLKILYLVGTIVKDFSIVSNLKEFGIHFGIRNSLNLNFTIYKLEEVTSMFSALSVCKDLEKASLKGCADEVPHFLKCFKGDVKFKELFIVTNKLHPVVVESWKLEKLWIKEARLLPQSNMDINKSIKFLSYEIRQGFHKAKHVQVIADVFVNLVELELLGERLHFSSKLSKLKSLKKFTLIDNVKREREIKEVITELPKLVTLEYLHFEYLGGSNKPNNYANELLQMKNLIELKINFMITDEKEFFEKKISKSLKYLTVSHVFRKQLFWIRTYCTNLLSVVSKNKSVQKKYIMKNVNLN